MDRSNRPLITTAALKLSDGLIVSMPPPARHNDIIKRLSQKLGPLPSNLAEQGFLTSTGRFVSRLEAATIAVEAGQILAPKWPPCLYSEDLW